MPNPNVFPFTVGDSHCYADPMKVRRVLLQHTMGKCWSVVREIRRSQDELTDARNKADELRKELETTPTTEDELKVFAEIQKAHAEQKQTNLPFDQFPRAYKADMYEGKVAILSNKIAQLEGTLAGAAYEAFDLPPFKLDDGSGVTESEALGVLKLFLEYAEGKGERLGS